MRPKGRILVATAGWPLPAASRTAFGDGASLLERYATRFPAVEINSSFYLPHRRATYARWAATVPPAFQFAVKAPRTITHLKRLVGCHDELARFCEEIAGLGAKLGVVLVQLPPSLAFDPVAFEQFIDDLRQLLPSPIAFEPRHPSWFGGASNDLLQRWRIGRVSADPAIVPEAGNPGGHRDMTYFRLHGSPRMYRSDYPPAELMRIAAAATAAVAHGTVWCVFDNTAEGHATANALAFKDIIEGRG